jgi:hypothetical protein
VDPTGMAEDWIPTVTVEKDEKGNATSAHLTLKAEANDNAETLAKFLQIENATNLYETISKAGEIALTDKIINDNELPTSLKSMNAHLTDALVLNPQNYTATDYATKGRSYNCNFLTTQFAEGLPVKYEPHSSANGTDMSGAEANSAFIRRFELKGGVEEATFGRTAMRFVNPALTDTELKYPHSAIFLGRSKDGTIYTFSKNGSWRPPAIVTATELHAKYTTTQIEYFNFVPK